MNWNTKLKLYHRWLTHQLRSERSRGNQRPSQQNASQRRTQDSIHDEYDQLDKITIEVLRKSGKDARKRQWLWSLSLSLFISFQTINRSMEKRKTQREEIACKGCQKEIAQIPDSLSFHSTPLLSLFSSRRRRRGRKQTGNHVQEEQEDEGIDRTISGLPDKKYWGRLWEKLSNAKRGKKDDRKHDAFLVQVCFSLLLFDLKSGIPFKNKFYSKVYISLSSVHVTLFHSLLILSSFSASSVFWMKIQV